VNPAGPHPRRQTWTFSGIFRSDLADKCLRHHGRTIIARGFEVRTAGQAEDLTTNKPHSGDLHRSSHALRSVGVPHEPEALRLKVWIAKLALTAAAGGRALIDDSSCLRRLLGAVRKAQLVLLGGGKGGDPSRRFRRYHGKISSHRRGTCILGPSTRLERALEDRTAASTTTVSEGRAHSSATDAL